MGKVLNEKVFTKLIRLKKAKHNNKIKTGAIQYDDSHYLFTDGIIIAKVKEKTLTEKMKTVSDFNEEQMRQVEKIFRDYEEKNLDEEELELLTDYTPYYTQDKSIYVLKGKGNGVFTYLDRNFVDPLLPYNPKFYATEDFSPVIIKIGNKMYALICSIKPSDNIVEKIRKDLEMLEFDKVIKEIGEYKKKSSSYLETAYSLDFNCKNGFFPCEVYNLDRSIALEILPRLLYFRDTTTTYPGGFDSLAEWKQELDNMCNEFYNYIFDEDSYSGSIINPYIKLAEYAPVLWN